MSHPNALSRLLTALIFLVVSVLPARAYDTRKPDDDKDGSTISVERALKGDNAKPAFSDLPKGKIDNTSGDRNALKTEDALSFAVTPGRESSVSVQRNSSGEVVLKGTFKDFEPAQDKIKSVNEIKANKIGANIQSDMPVEVTLSRSKSEDKKIVVSRVAVDGTLKTTDAVAFAVKPEARGRVTVEPTSDGNVVMKGTFRDFKVNVQNDIADKNLNKGDKIGDNIDNDMPVQFTLTHSKTGIALRQVSVDGTLKTSDAVAFAVKPGSEKLVTTQTTEEGNVVMKGAFSAFQPSVQTDIAKQNGNKGANVGANIKGDMPVQFTLSNSKNGIAVRQVAVDGNLKAKDAVAFAVKPGSEKLVTTDTGKDGNIVVKGPFSAFQDDVQPKITKNHQLSSSNGSGAGIDSGAIVSVNLRNSPSGVLVGAVKVGESQNSVAAPKTKEADKPKVEDVGATVVKTAVTPEASRPEAAAAEPAAVMPTVETGKEKIDVRPTVTISLDKTIAPSDVASIVGNNTYVKTEAVKGHDNLVKYTVVDMSLTGGASDALRSRGASYALDAKGLMQVTFVVDKTKTSGAKADVTDVISAAGVSTAVNLGGALSPGETDKMFVESAQFLIRPVEGKAGVMQYTASVADLSDTGKRSLAIPATTSPGAQQNTIVFLVDTAEVKPAAAPVTAVAAAKAPTDEAEATPVIETVVAPGPKIRMETTVGAAQLKDVLKDSSAVRPVAQPDGSVNLKVTGRQLTQEFKQQVLAMLTPGSGVARNVATAFKQGGPINVKLAAESGVLVVKSIDARPAGLPPINLVADGNRLVPNATDVSASARTDMKAGLGLLRNAVVNNAGVKVISAQNLNEIGLGKTINSLINNGSKIPGIKNERLIQEIKEFLPPARLTDAGRFTQNVPQATLSAVYEKLNQLGR